MALFLFLLPPPADARGGAAAEPATRAGGALTREEAERFLAQASIIKWKRVPKGRTEARRATLSDGRFTHDAQVQTIDVSLPLFKMGEHVEKDFKDSYKFNIAAYRLDRLLSLNMTPVSVYRVVRGKPAAVTWWVDGVWMDELERRRANRQPPDRESWEAYMCNIRVFDQLIANRDRNQENLLITGDWRVWMIDHTRAFRDSPAIREPAELLGIDPDVLQALRGLTEERVKEQLGDFLTGRELSALLSRRGQIVRIFDRLIAEQGARAIFTPLPEHR